MSHDIDNVQFPGRVAPRKFKLIVEPLTVVFMLAYGLLNTLRVEYLDKRLMQKVNFTQTSTNTSLVCSLNESSHDYELYVEVQDQTSYWTLYLAVAQAVPALVSANVLGAVSDLKGRRVAMVFPIIGYIIYSIINALTAIFHWPLYILIIGAVPLGMCGDFFTLVASSFAYVADTTTPKQRTYRMVILECMTSLSPGIGQVAVGFMVQKTGFPPVYFLITGLMLVCLVYLYFLPESLTKTTAESMNANSATGEPSRRSFNVAKFFRSLADLFRPDENGRCWKMISYNVILFEFVLLIVSFLSISVLFATGEPFCWSPAQIGLFNGLTFIFAGFGLVVGGYVIRICCSDHLTMQFSILSFMASLLMLAFAKNGVMIFLVTAVGCLRMLAMPICRAKMSKLVSPSDQGILFACSGCIQSVATLLSPLIFNALYPLTLRVSNGFSFVVMATTLLVPVAITVALQIDDRRNKPVKYAPVQ
ncbi:lysosomal proton-coupled steroid conjugate and bile acid symporter SLC46A3-like [Diadema antillarum]|uniref:lysosomal proton-coupled steroid conjugate and bile acid symporter SLC46A3-like n=1 Tax=Diadema antillarum TaxID=105358 RepID=UPI003A83B1E1